MKTVDWEDFITYRIHGNDDWRIDSSFSVGCCPVNDAYRYLRAHETETETEEKESTYYVHRYIHDLGIFIVSFFLFIQSEMNQK